MTRAKLDSLLVIQHVEMFHNYCAQVYTDYITGLSARIRKGQLNHRGFSGVEFLALCSHINRLTFKNIESRMSHQCVSLRAGSEVAYPPVGGEANLQLRSDWRNHSTLFWLVTPVR